MKQLSRLLVVALILFGVNNIQAQDEDNPWQFTIGINAIDVYPTNADPASFLPSYETGGLFMSISTQVTIGTSCHPFRTLDVSSYVGNGFSVGVRGSLNRIDKLGDTGLTMFHTTLLMVPLSTHS